MPTWPGSLPQKPAAESLRGGPRGNQIAFTPDVGDQVTRRRGSAVRKEYQVRFSAITLTQLETFETFFVTDLVDGTLTFDWVDPIHGDASVWRIKAGDDLPYEIADVGPDLYDLSMTLIRLPG